MNRRELSAEMRARLRRLVLRWKRTAPAWLIEQTLAGALRTVEEERHAARRAEEEKEARR